MVNTDPLGLENEDDIWVTTPAGSSFPVMNDDERAYYEGISDRYQTDNLFSNITDLQDLDQILGMELMCQRWRNWLSREKDYWDQPVDPSMMQKYINDFSKEIRYLKKNINIDKSSRDKERAESVATYIHNLGVRAKEFGITRNKQAESAITLFKELESLIVLHDNMTPDERNEGKRTLIVTADDIFEWIRTRAIPEMNAIDEEFRSTSQAYWIEDV